MTFLACLIAFQIGEAFLWGSVWSQSCLTLYFALRMSIHKLSLFETIIHANFAMRALLISLAFLKLSPLRLLGWQSLSHALQARKFPWFFGFHPKLLVDLDPLDFPLNGECSFHGQDWFEINERLGCATSFKKILTNATCWHLILQPAFNLTWRVKG